MSASISLQNYIYSLSGFSYQQFSKYFDITRERGRERETRAESNNMTTVLVRLVVEDYNAVGAKWDWGYEKIEDKCLGFHRQLELYKSMMMRVLEFWFSICRCRIISKFFSEKKNFLMHFMHEWNIFKFNFFIYSVFSLHIILKPPHLAFFMHPHSISYPHELKHFIF